MKRFDLDNPDGSTQFQHCNLLLTQNRAFPVQPTANVIECRSYNKLPLSAKVLDTTELWKILTTINGWPNGRV